MELDDLDMNILKMLQKDGKISCEEIAQRLDRSASTVRDRIRKLEDRHIIIGYTTIVDEEYLGIHSDAFISTSVESGDVNEAIIKLYTIENISEILQVTGEKRVIFRVKSRDHQELNAILDRKIRPLGFDNFEVTVILKPLVRYPGII